MVQFLFQHNVFIYFFTFLCGLGLLFRFILDMVYIHLLRESDNLYDTKNKHFSHMKIKFETCYRLNLGVNNVDTFVDKNVLSYRFCGILLSTWENLSGQVLLLTFLTVPISSVFGVIFNCGKDQILISGAVGILSGSILILVDKMINLSSKKLSIRLNLMDYLENFCKVRLEHEAYNPELMEQYRREYFKSIEKKNKENLVVNDESNELSRRREARRKKEEEKRAAAQKRAEELRKLEEFRKQEQIKRMEERKAAAMKRRQEELLKMEEERKLAEIKSIQDKQNELRELIKQKKAEEVQQLNDSIEEIAADKADKDVRAESNRETNPSTNKGKGSIISKQEEKLIEDVLKEFFA